MRPIQVSTDVFAAIWASRQVGEATEDDILRRKLGIGPKTSEHAPTRSAIGFRDPRSGTEFPEGFEIFRTYLGADYVARAELGEWCRSDTKERFSSLNELSRSIGAKTENAWANWFYLADDGIRCCISDLRDPSKIARRTKMPARRLG